MARARVAVVIAWAGALGASAWGGACATPEVPPSDGGPPAPRALAVRADAFVCREEADAERCRQRYPRAPDDGEWACFEKSGVAICFGGERPAGVVPGAPDPKFVCGARRGPAGGRVCVDTSPDRPRTAHARHRCDFENGDALSRICTSAAHVALVGDPCDGGERAGGCDPGLACRAGRCELPEGLPECVFDADCEPETQCLFARCARRGR